MAVEADAASALLYAELLPNIRQISVGCLLPSPSSRQTKVRVSPDGEHLIVHHNGQDASLKLPGRAESGLTPPVREGQSNIAFRLPVLAPDGGTKGFVRPAAEPQAVPWSATDILRGCPLRCRQCEAVVIAQGVLSTWKDLPSENWAEMMEFWHCHKPDEHKQDGEDHGHDHNHDHLAATRGYGASSRIAAQPGLGFVDLTSFLVSTSDVLPNTKVSKPARSPVTASFSGMPTDTPTQDEERTLKTGRSSKALRSVHALVHRDHGLLEPGFPKLEGRLDLYWLPMPSAHLCVLGSFLGCGNLRSIPELDWPLASIEPKQADDTEVHTSNNQVLATCRSCKARLALVTPETSSVTLFKWQVKITTTDSVAATQGSREDMPSVAHCVSAMLLATLSRTGCSKSILMPIKTSHQVSSSRNGHPEDKLLHIWLFNPNITYSSSVAARMGDEAGGDRPQAAVKVLYRFVAEEEADKLLHSMTLDTQDISLPVDAIESVAELLRHSNSFLPPGERVFKEWTVGLVSRWQQ